MEAIGPIASSKDGIYLAGGAPSGNVYIWEVWDLVLGRVLQIHAFSVAVTVMAVDPVEQLLFSGNEDGRIHVTELNIGLQENPTVISEDDSGVLCGHKEAITALAFSSGGLWLISASKDCTACLWDVKTWQVVRKFSHGKGCVTNLVVIPQSSLSASENSRNCRRPCVSQLDKAPQPNIAPRGTVAFLPTYCSQEDHVLIPSFQSSRLINKHILDLEQGRTLEAIQMKVEACVESRQLTVRMTKNMMSINKILQSRLLDLMQLRLCNASEVAFSSRRVKTNVPEEKKTVS